MDFTKEIDRMSPDKIVIKNKVKEFCDKKDLDRLGFIGVCLQSKRTINGRRLQSDTAGRVYDGETGITIQTAGLVAAALGVKIGDLFELQQ